MEVKVHKYQVRILESHLDAYGHLNNATYLVLLEEARWDLVTAGGFGQKHVVETGVGTTLLDISLRFKREIRLQELITIETRMTYFRGKVGEIAQEMINEAGQVCCVAKMKIGMFDLKTRKLVAPAKEWLEAVGYKAN